MIDALIFDLDGTLWNSTSTVTEAWNNVVSRHGVRAPFQESDIAGIMGLSHSEIIRKLFPGQETVGESISKECYDEEIKLLLEKGAVLYDGVIDGIQSLSKNYPLYLVSNCQTDYLQAFFEITQLKRYFTDSECHGSSGKSKAENIALLMHCHQLKTPVYIGDTEKDWKACLECRIPFYQAAYGFGPEIESVPRFQSFSSLLDHFNQLL